MTKQIIPSTYLEYCPVCHGVLDLSFHREEQPSACTQCNYTEPAGNAEIVTFLSHLCVEYALQANIDTVFLKDNEFTIRECMEGNGLLPLFVERADQILGAAGLANIPGFSLGLRVIEDIKGLLLSRVVIATPSLCIANTMAVLCEVLHETMLLTRELNTKFYGNQICLDYMPNINPAVGLSSPQADSLHRAIQAATLQSPQGAPGERR